MALQDAAGAGAKAHDARAIDQLAGQIDPVATPIDRLEQAVRLAAVRVFLRRAQALRARAAGLITTASDGRGRMVRIVAPEAVIMLGTAEFFESCAVDLAGGAA